MLIALIVALAALGLVAQLAQRRLGAPLLLSSAALTARCWPRRALEPVRGREAARDPRARRRAAAGLGLVGAVAAPAARVARVAAVGLALACGGAVLCSDALAAHGARLAPTDRMEALEDAAEHAGGGYWLVNEWEEYAKYFARSSRATTRRSESESPDVVTLRKAGPIFGQYFDLDEQTLEFVQRFDGILMRRSPVASRPPADFRRVYANDYYELWRRDRRVRVREHLPLGRPLRPDGRAELRRRARPRRRGRARRAASSSPPRGPACRDGRDHPRRGAPGRAGCRMPSRPRIVSLHTPGRLHGHDPHPEPGRYRAWLQLSSGRPMRGADRRPRGRRAARGQHAGAVAAGRRGARWTPGVHRVELLRARRPPAAGRRLRRRARARSRSSPSTRRARGSSGVAPSRRASGLCGSGRCDWVEAVAPVSDPVTVAIPVRDGGGLLGEVLDAVRGAAARPAASSCSWPTRARATAPASWPGAAARPCSPSSASRTAAPATG